MVWKPGHYLLLALGLYALVLTLGFSLRGRQLQRLYQEVQTLKQELRTAPPGYRPPLPGACLPEDPDLLPGAPRAYRKGVNPGFVFVHGQSCVPVVLGTGVVAAATGEVVRADLDYEPLAPEAFQALLARVREGAGPEEMNLLRGRQVWLKHPDGRVSVYAHLDGVAPGVRPGVLLRRGEALGYVGRSGLPPGAAPRLLFEVWEGEPDRGRFLFQGLPPERLLPEAKRFFGLE